MYLYRTCHEILSIIIDENRQYRKPDQIVSTKLIAEKIGNEKRAAKGLSALAGFKYVRYALGKGKDGYPRVFLVDAGLDAFSKQEFKKLQNTAVFNAVRDVSLIVSGIVVAAATTYTLLRPNDLAATIKELQLLREELRSQKGVLTNQEDRLDSIELDIMRIGNAFKAEQPNK